MYTNASEIGWDNPTEPRRQKRDLPTEKLGQNHGAVTDSDDIVSQFWQVWQDMHDQLYRCCLKMMNSNRADAEDALSRAMLKAWEKVQKFGGKIANLKAWLYRLTRNFCLDIIREHSRGAVGVESIEWVGNTSEMSTAARVECPESVLEREERSDQIRGAIAELPEKLRETFILHFYRELSHKEIAQQQEISYQNVCKRISQARKILREELRGYFVGEETDSELDSEMVVETDAETRRRGDAETSEVLATSATTESAVGEISQRNGGVEPIVGETVSLSEVMEEVETVGEEAMEDLSYPEIAQQQEISQRNGGVGPVVEEMVSLSEVVEEVETVGEEGMEDLSYPETAQQQEISYQNVCQRIFLAWKIWHKELRRYFIRKDEADSDLSATSERKLEVRSDGCRCIEATLCERQSAPILAFLLYIVFYIFNSLSRVRWR